MNSHVPFHFQKQVTSCPSLRQTWTVGHPLKCLGSDDKLCVTLGTGLLAPAIIFKGRAVLLPKHWIHSPERRDPGERRRWQQRGSVGARGAPGHLMPHQAHRSFCTSPTVCLPLPEDGRGNVARAGGVGAAATSVRSPSTAIASACSAPGTVAPQEP